MSIPGRAAPTYDGARQVHRIVQCGVTPTILHLGHIGAGLDKGLPATVVIIFCCD